ncbi:MAG: homoserine dehydrogenase [Clostridiales bacterium]|nr:homoserine dehydrogenase [Clostridiales bacterium]
MVNVAVLGYGTVGSGTAEILWNSKEELSRRIGDEINLKYVLDLRDFPGDKVEEVLVHDYEVIANDPEVDIVVEVMGGIEPANTFARKALSSGKSFITSNKALVAEYGSDLMKLARENNVSFLFEASVGGGIPIIRPLNTALTAEDIEEVSGILNGTTNYMMTKMFFDGVDYDEVLKDAQAKGYAEANPSADVDGIDACRKIAILSSIVSGKFVNYKEIYTEGISKLTTKDFEYAKKLGRRIKLLANAIKKGDELTAMVAPYLVSEKHLLFNVTDVFNAVMVRGCYVGDVMFYGQGAGKLPTASAVVGDIVDAARSLGRTLPGGWGEGKQELCDHKELVQSYLVRLEGGAERLEEVKAAFGEVEVVEAGVCGEIGFVTAEMSENEYEEKAAKLSGILGMIRIGE